MNNFETALRLSNDEWVDSLPNELEDYQLSKVCQNKMNSILNQAEELKVKSSRKQTLRYLLIAAIIAFLLLASTVAASPASKKFLIDKFSDHSVYTVQTDNNGLKQTDLVCDYIPDGFTLDEVHSDANGYIVAYEYSCKDYFYTVDKSTDAAVVTFDTEHYEPIEIEFNGITYLYFKKSETFSGVIWNNSGYIYTIGGNISKQELLEIAKYTK